MKTPIINIISTHNLTLTYQKHVAKCLWGDGNSHLFNMAIQSLLSCLNQNIWTQVCVVALCVRTLQTFFTFLRLGESWLVLTGNTHAIILYSFFCRSDWWCCSNCGVYTVLGEFRMSCLMQGVRVDRDTSRCYRGPVFGVGYVLSGVYSLTDIFWLWNASSMSKT